MIDTEKSGNGWRRLGVLVLGLAAVGLPVNDLPAYALLVLLTVVAMSGTVSAQPRAWGLAVAVVAIAVLAKAVIAPPRIHEGHNVFLPKSEVLQKGLPADVYRHLAATFDAVYPGALRCDPKNDACWQGQPLPDRTFAFSGDSVFHRSDMSRAVTGVDFTDPVWLGLGFVNEHRYNWSSTAPDVHRGDRDRRFFMGVKRWQFAMPWFEMIRLPAAFVGGSVCWRGEVLWEGADERFSVWRGDGCRPIEAADAGRRVVGVGIKPGTLAMQVVPPWTVRLQQSFVWALAVAAVGALMLLLAPVRARRTLWPFLLIGLALIVIVVDDASFIGGLRPFDGGDDGLFYDGVGRLILQKVLAGDIWGALEGGEKVFYYGGPGLRYMRALEHIVFGETYLGYLSLVLVLPFAVFALFRRFLPQRWAATLAVMFVAVPLGAVFGTSFLHYAKWAGRGFADPAAYILFIAGLAVVIGPRPHPKNTFTASFFGAVLMALGICMKPIIAPAAAVFLAGAGLAALMRTEWRRVIGLTLGVLPVFSMALHNWVFGRVFVLFSSNSGDANLLVMPPSVYLGVLRDLATFNVDSDNVSRFFFQMVNWLSNPAESAWTLPVNAAGIVILIAVVVRGRQFDPWIRLIGVSALAQHAVAFFYNAATARYHFLTWFLTMLVVMVWVERVGIGWLSSRAPVLSARIASLRVARWFRSGVATLEKVSS